MPSISAAATPTPGRRPICPRWASTSSSRGDTSTTLIMVVGVSFTLCMAGTSSPEMWRAAVAFSLLILAGGGYETWALAFRPGATITALVKRHTHLAIILGGATFTLFGYILGVGGQ